MINKKTFFATLRKSSAFATFDAVQVSVIDAIINEFERRRHADLRWLAYMLATAKGECNFRPVREIGRGKGRAYGKPDKRTGKTYYGRGLVQLTWYDNYKRMGETLDIDLLRDPDRALEVGIAVAIMFEGMTTGATDKDSFTKYQLHDFFNATTNDPVEARRIINGTDKAKTFARWHNTILEALRAADMRIVQAPSPVPAPVEPETGNATPEPPQAKPGPSAEQVGGAVIVGAGGVAGTLGVPWGWVIGLGLAAIAAIVIVKVVLNRKRRA